MKLRGPGDGDRSKNGKNGIRTCDMIELVPMTLNFKDKRIQRLGNIIRR